MLNKLFLIISILLFSGEFFCVNKAAAQNNVEEVKISPKATAKSIEDITAELEEQSKKNQPFDDKKVKIDLESLGLDNVDEKPAQALEKTKIITNNAVENVAAANDQEIKPAANDMVIKAQQKENEIVSGAKNIITKIQNFVTSKPSVEAPLDQPTSKYDIKRPVNNYLKLDKKTALKKRINFEKKKSEIAKIKKEQEEKMLRLNKLREEYLVEVNQDNSANSSLGEPIIKPREKNLSWSDRFISYETPPSPILERYRGNDNKHIPIILSTKEKIDIMFAAIAQGNVAAFNDAYKDILNPDTYNSNGDTILTFAIITQKYPVIASVLAKGADPDLPNDLGHTPLDIAIEMLDLKAANMLVDAKANPFYVDGFGRNYLMHAARVGFYPMCDFLYSQGIDIDATDDEGFTALAIAYRHKKEIIAKFLLSKGAKTWIEKKYQPERQNLIKDLENRWKKG